MALRLIQIVKDRARGATWQDLAAAGLAAIAFIIYAIFRARYVGGCDQWAYHAASLALRGIDPGLGLTRDMLAAPATIPLCYERFGAAVLPVFPMGYPALLAATGLVGWDAYLNPLLGAASVGLVYVLTARRAGRTAALGLALLFATSPIVLWGATQKMSDLPAAFFALLAVVTLERGRYVPAAVALGIGVGIRPNMVLLLPALLLLCRDRGRLVRFGIACAACLALFLAHNLAAYGSLWDTPYSRTLHDTGAAGLLDRLRFYAGTTLELLWPLAPFWILAVHERPREGAPLLAWFFAFFAFFLFWRPGASDWWWVRYLLPAYPALFALAASGLWAGAEAHRARRPRWMPAIQAACAVALAAGVAVNIGFSVRKDLFSGRIDIGYYNDSLAVAAKAEKGSLVGAVNFTGPLRLYAGLETFRWDHPEARALVDRALAAGRAVYLVAEPWELGRNPLLEALTADLDVRKVIDLTNWPKLELLGLAAKPAPVSEVSGTQADGTVLVDFGKAEARPFLASGWSVDEYNAEASWVWAEGGKSALEVPLQAATPYDVELRTTPMRMPEGKRQEMQVRINGALAHAATLLAGQHTYGFRIPAELVAARNAVELEFAYSLSPAELGDSKDARKLTASLEWMRFRPVPVSPAP